MTGSPHALRQTAAAVPPSLVAVFMLGILGSPAAAPLHAQTLTLEPGTRLRVTLEGARRSVVATVVEMRPDTIVLGRAATPIPATMPLAVPQIRRLEVSIGDRSMAPAGALVGALTGAALVGAYNRVRAGQCFRSCPRNFPVLVGAGVGGAVGGVSLAFVRVDRWREVMLPARR